MKTYNYISYYYFADSTQATDAGKAGAAVKGDPTSKPDGKPKPWAQLDQGSKNIIFDACKFYLATNRPVPEKFQAYAADLKTAYNEAKKAGSIDEQALKKEASSSDAKKVMNQNNSKGKSHGIRNFFRGYGDAAQKLAMSKHLTDAGLKTSGGGASGGSSGGSSNSFMDMFKNPAMMAAMMGSGGGGNPFMMMYMMQMMQNMGGGSNNSAPSSAPNITARDAASLAKSIRKSRKATARDIQKTINEVKKVYRKDGEDAAREMATALGYNIEDMGILPNTDNTLEEEAKKADNNTNATPADKVEEALKESQNVA